MPHGDSNKPDDLICRMIPMTRAAWDALRDVRKALTKRGMDAAPNEATFAGGILTVAIVQAKQQIDPDVIQLAGAVPRDARPMTPEEVARRYKQEQKKVVLG